MVSKIKSENQSLADTVRSLNRDYKQLLESKSQEKTHFDATLKLKLATLEQNHKCDVTELELIQKKKIWLIQRTRRRSSASKILS